MQMRQLCNHQQKYEEEKQAMICFHLGKRAVTPTEMKWDYWPVGSTDHLVLSAVLDYRHPPPPHDHRHQHFHHHHHPQLS